MKTFSINFNVKIFTFRVSALGKTFMIDPLESVVISGTRGEKDEIEHAQLKSIQSTIQKIKTEKPKNETKKTDKMLEIAYEDKFNHGMTIKLIEVVQTNIYLLNDKMHANKKNLG